MPLTFDEESVSSSSLRATNSHKPGWSISDWMVKKGVVKNAKSANILSLAFAAVCLIIAIFIMIKVFSKPSQTDQPFIEKPTTAVYY
jgi:hypothetical protein